MNDEASQKKHQHQPFRLLAHGWILASFVQQNALLFALSLSDENSFVSRQLAYSILGVSKAKKATIGQPSAVAVSEMRVTKAKKKIGREQLALATYTAWPKAFTFFGFGSILTFSCNEFTDAQPARLGPVYVLEPAPIFTQRGS